MTQVWTRARPFLPLAFGLIVVAVIFLVVLPSIAPWSEVWAVVQDLSWPAALLLLAAAALNVVTFAFPWMAVLPGLPFRSALAVTLTSNASNYVLPGGTAVGMGVSFAMLRSWGYGGRSATVALTAAWVWNLLVKFGFPVLALALVTYEGGAYPLLATLAWTGVVLFGVAVLALGAALSREEHARRLGKFSAAVTSRALALLRRPPVSWGGDSFVRFRDDALDLIAARWHVLTITTIVGHVTAWLVLVVSLRALDVPVEDVSLIESFAAWSLALLVGTLPITPGGFGVVELTLSAALIAFGGGEAEVLAAVMIYRALTVAPPLVLGAVAAMTWRRYNPRAQAT
jgi:putative heme transporter